MMMREAHRVNYNLSQTLNCMIQKLTKEKFISECKYFYKEKQSKQRDKHDSVILEDFTSDDDDSDDDESPVVWIKNWQPKDGVFPACLQYICENHNISHYAYVVVNKCFLKHVVTQ